MALKMTNANRALIAAEIQAAYGRPATPGEINSWINDDSYFIEDTLAKIRASAGNATTSAAAAPAAAPAPAATNALVAQPTAAAPTVAAAPAAATNAFRAPVARVQPIPGTNQFINTNTGLIYNADQVTQQEVGIGEGTFTQTVTKPDVVAVNEPTLAGFAQGSFDSESGAFSRPNSLYEDVWKELARAQGIEPTVTVEFGSGGEDSQPVTYANPDFINYVQQKKAEGLDVSVNQTPGYKYKFDVAVTQNGQPVSEPKSVDYGKGFFSSISSAVKELSPILIPVLTAGFAAPLGAAMGATAGSTAASALGGATIAGGVTALGGGSLKDVLGAAAIGGVAPYASEALGLTGGGAGGGGVGFSGLENELAGLGALEASMATPGAALGGIETALAGGAAGVGAYQQAAGQLAAADIAARAAGAAGAAGTAGATGAGAAGAAGQAAAGAAGSALGNLGTAALVGAAGDILGGIVQSKAAETAADAQERAAMAGIEEMRRQFNVSKEILQPYVSAGTQAIGGLQPYMQGGQQAYQQQLALAGVLGPEAQKAAIGQIESSPFFQSQVEQGERALLQRASATGGLRGGNLQAGLAQFRPQMLQQAIEQQYGRLGGLSAAGLETGGLVSRLGQASAAGQASQAGALGQGVAGLMQQQGAAQAGAALAGAAPWQALANIPGQLAGLSLATGRPITSLFG